ncbi:MAG: hypothetical protein ACJ739_00675 [Acidimicrobiales bacterium]
MTAVHLIAGIAWDPQIRGFLAVLVGVVVLMGSVYLLLGTNLGSRLGFLVAISAVFGWCTIMGITWWVYGSIGMLGEINHWTVEEVVYQPDGTAEEGLDLADLDEAHEIDTTKLPPPEDVQEMNEEAIDALEERAADALGDWKILAESNPAFGEAKATVDEHFVATPLEALGIEGAADYVTVYSFETGGKEDLPPNPTRWDRISHKFKNTFLHPTHPSRYAIIQVHPVIDQEAKPGQAPPTPEPDPSKPTVSVIMSRDLGSRRLPGAVLTMVSGLLFLATLVMLHQRDLRAAQARGLLPGPAEA